MDPKTRRFLERVLEAQDREPDDEEQIATWLGRELIDLRAAYPEVKASEFADLLLYN